MPLFSDRLREIEKQAPPREPQPKPEMEPERRPKLDLLAEDQKTVNEIIEEIKRVAESRAKQHEHCLGGLVHRQNYGKGPVIFTEMTEVDAYNDILLDDSIFSMFEPHDMRSIGFDLYYMMDLFRETLSNLGLSHNVKLVRKNVLKMGFMDKGKYEHYKYLFEIYIFVEW